MSPKQKSNFVLFALIVLVTLSRFLPHPPNFSPVAALALFGGSLWAGRKWVLLVPVAIMLVSDVILGLHSSMIFVYGAMLAIAGLGTLIKKTSFKTVGLGALSASLLFFFVTNFGVWLMSGMYAKTFDGLVASYVAGVPFFHNTLLSNLVYSGLLFSLWSLVSKEQELTAPA